MLVMLRYCVRRLSAATTMNRRLTIFIFTFIIACVVGFGYTYSLVPTYVATAAVQVIPPTSSSGGQEGAAFVANEAQVLNSNQMLEAVLATMTAPNARATTYDSVSSLRNVLSARPSGGSNIIELRAIGAEREQLASLLDTWAAEYLQSRTKRRTAERDASIEEARKAVTTIAARVAAKRTELDGFRSRHSIVSLQREENQVATQMTSLNRALNDARNKLTEAESRLSTLEAGVAEGKPVYRAQDRGTLAQLERRALDLREKLTELERNYTPQYLAMEPRVRTLRANLENVERKIEATERSSHHQMVNEARREVQTARSSLARLEAQLGERRKDALNFTSRFAEHKAQTSELAQLETELGHAKQRLAMLERTERAREPKYDLLGSAVVAEKAVHPDYGLHAAYTVGGAFAVALLAVLLVDFLNPKPQPQPAYPQPIIQIAYPALEGHSGGELPRLANPRTPLLGTTDVLPGSAPSPRELTVPEVRELWHAATGDARLVVAALFSGLTLDELATLQWDAVDLDAGVVHLGDSRARSFLLTAPLRQELQARRVSRSGEGRVAATSDGGTMLSLADLKGLVAAAAHDAGLNEAENIDPEVLRHTYLSFLVRQGPRLADLEHLAGAVPPALFLYYRKLTPAGSDVPLAAINRVFPAFALA